MDHDEQNDERTKSTAIADSGRRGFLKKTAITAATVAGAGSLGTVATANEAALPKPLPKPKDPIWLASDTGQAMPQKPLGSTGESIPILQLGTAQDLDPKYDKVMHLCYREGVTYLDTALAYGRGASHRAVANFMKQVNNRKSLWITSKSTSRSVSGITAGLDQCLEELETDYIDMYFMHGISGERYLEPEYIQAGEALKKTGKTKFFGFSCHDGDVVPLMNKAAKVGGIDAILFRYNFRKYGDMELNKAIDNCKKAGIGLIAMKTMASVPKQLEDVVLFRSQNYTLAQAKLKSVWADERIDSVVSEMDSVQVARENIVAAKAGQALSANEVHQLNQLAAMTSSYHCNGCAQLCEKAVGQQTAIADPLRFLMYYECYGKTARAKELYQAIPAAKRQFSGDALAKAAAVCPQKINIESRLQLAESLLA